MAVHGACLPTHSGMNRQPSAATRRSQDGVKFPYAQAQFTPPR